MVCIKDVYTVYTHVTGAARLSGLATAVCFAFEFGVLFGIHEAQSVLDSLQVCDTTTATFRIAELRILHPGSPARANFLAR